MCSDPDNVSKRRFNTNTELVDTLLFYFFWKAQDSGLLWNGTLYCLWLPLEGTVCKTFFFTIIRQIFFNNITFSSGLWKFLQIMNSIAPIMLSHLWCWNKKKKISFRCYPWWNQEMHSYSLSIFFRK